MLRKGVFLLRPSDHAGMLRRVDHLFDSFMQECAIPREFYRGLAIQSSGLIFPSGLCFRAERCYGCICLSLPNPGCICLPFSLTQVVYVHPTIPRWCMCTHHTQVVYRRPCHPGGYRRPCHPGGYVHPATLVGMCTLLPWWVYTTPSTLVGIYHS